MRISVVGIAVCGAALAALAVAVLPATLPEAAVASTGTVLGLLTLVGGALLLAVAAWCAALNRRERPRELPVFSQSSRPPGRHHPDS